jgi:putative Holliday junction resolvase
MDPQAKRTPGRIVALDYGRRRVGVAASDPLRIIAKPRAAVAAGSPPMEPSRELLDLLAELEPGVIVLGIPLNMDGSEGEMALEAREFGRRLFAACAIPIRERDERLSTVEAERTIRQLGLPKHKREQKGLRDMMAAAVLLDDYMREDGS